ncbi:hypothetical protein EVAR_13737_1 [Eumeta japonica]|uniref:Uncharacterized protein n=1 Tax=Eumeta variegata TaxID=151549 RepID=A0A4C1UCD0_EUMVA|nr:hypothetical protein EVAR_13737_1 [Eumeta japonica]
MTNDLCEGRPSTATAEYDISAVRFMIVIDKRVTYQQIWRKLRHRMRGGENGTTPATESETKRISNGRAQGIPAGAGPEKSPRASDFICHNFGATKKPEAFK